MMDHDDPWRDLDGNDDKSRQEMKRREGKREKGLRVPWDGQVGIIT